MKHIRQGDLLFVRVRDVKKAKEYADGRVLAHGEVTGHAHAIAEADFGNCDVYLDEEGRLIVVVKRDRVSVVHEEHGRIELEAGAWEVRHQREYEPEGWRQVAD